MDDYKTDKKDSVKTFDEHQKNPNLYTWAQSNKLS